MSTAVDTGEQQSKPPEPRWTPRAIAVLVALRGRALTTSQIRHAIGDSNVANTRKLIVDMRGEALIKVSDDQGNGVVKCLLDEEGWKWLNANGLFSTT